MSLYCQEQDDCVTSLYAVVRLSRGKIREGTGRRRCARWRLCTRRRPPRAPADLLYSSGRAWRGVFSRIQCACRRGLSFRKCAGSVIRRSAYVYEFALVCGVALQGHDSPDVAKRYGNIGLLNLEGACRSRRQGAKEDATTERCR